VIDIRSLGKHIKDLRRAKGWTIYRLGKESGVDKGQLAKLEQGAKGNVTIETINRIAIALDVRTGKLLSECELKEKLDSASRTDQA
jgi:XRE family transcriptional regulator, regulator of sulfur utilization